jgi:tetratricopeptide (TPR) repeat protein
MTKARLNTTLLSRTAVLFVALAVIAWFLHGWQVRRFARGQLARAAEAQQQGNKEESIASLRRYLAFDPSDQAVRVRYGLTLAAEASTPRERWLALQTLRQVLALDPAQSDLATAAARLALALNEPVEASRYLVAALRHHPNRADLHELYGQAQIRSGNLQGAAQSLTRALELAPDRISSAALLAELLCDRLSQPRQADAVLNRLVINNPRSAKALLLRAQGRLTSGRLDLGRQDLDRARALAPRDADVLAKSAELAALRGEFAAAAAGWLAVLKQKPKEISAYRGLVRAEQERGGASQQAIDALRQGLQHLPNHPDLLFALADLLIERHEPAAAEALRKRLPKIGAKGHSLYLEGRIHQEHERWPEAVRAFTAAAQAGDLSAVNGGRLMRALARCQAERENREEQVAAMRHAVRLDPTPSARLELARVLLANRGGEEALALLRSLVKTKGPSETWVLLARALIEQNMARPVWQRTWSEVEQTLQAAEKARANPVDVALLRARMHLVRDEQKEAERGLLLARSEHPDQPALWKACADLALLKGDRAAAEKIMAEADKRLGNAVEWLLIRAGDLASRNDRRAALEMDRLEATAATLPAADRDRLERYMAEVLHQQGNIARVEHLCRGILQRHAGDLRARRLLLDGKLANGDDAGAARLIAEMRKLEGEEGTAWRRAAAAAAWSQVQRGDRSRLPEAKALVREVLRRRPNQTQALVLEGQIADLEGKQEQALASYRRALQLGEYHPIAVRRLVQILLDAGRYGDASDVLEVVQSAGALGPALLRPAATIALRAGKQERACALARLVVPAGTKSARDLIWLGQLLDEAGRVTEAEDALSEAVRVRPQRIDPWLALLAYQQRHNLTEESEATLAEMKTKLPADLVPHALAQTWEVQQQWQRAERAYRRILSREPREVTTWQRLLRLYLRGNRNAEAERVLELLLGPTLVVPEEELPALRRQLALVMTAPEHGNVLVGRALSLLAVNRASEGGDTVANLRVAALVRGVIEDQTDAALRTLERLPGGRAVLTEEKLRLAGLYDRAGNWRRCRELLLELLAGDVSNTALMAVLLDGLLRHGKKAEAAGWLEHLEKLEPAAARTREFRERLKRLRR